MLTIRPFAFTDADYRAYLRIQLANFPWYPIKTVEGWQYVDQTRDPKYLFRRDVIELDGCIAAMGDLLQIPEVYHPQKAHFFVIVDPEQEQPGVREAYLDHILASTATERDLIGLFSGVLADNVPHLRFFEEQCFQEVMRAASSLLDVTTFDPAPFAGIEEKMQAANIEILSLPELQERDPQWLENLHELDWVLMQDVPSTAPTKKRTLEEFQTDFLAGPSFDPEGYLVALDGDQLVGMTNLKARQGDSDEVSTGLTGVLRSYRRNGIATALKLRAIDLTRQRGVKYIITSNEANNPMLTLNRRLGFVSIPDYIAVEKDLREGA